MLLSFIAICLIQRKKRFAKVSEDRLIMFNQDTHADLFMHETIFVDLKSLNTNDFPTFKESFWKSKTFQIWLMILLGSCFPIFISGVFKSYGERYIDNDSYITTVGAIGSLLNGLTRNIWPNMQEKFGFKI
jgi:hypothetical protein